MACANFLAVVAQMVVNRRPQCDCLGQSHPPHASRRTYGPPTATIFRMQAQYPYRTMPYYLENLRETKLLVGSFNFYNASVTLYPPNAWTCSFAFGSQFGQKGLRTEPNQNITKCEWSKLPSSTIIGCMWMTWSGRASRALAIWE